MLVIILLMRQDQFIITTKKNKKGIYGKASIKEVKELLEEGIEVETVPWINDKEN